MKYIVTVTDVILLKSLGVVWKMQYTSEMHSTWGNKTEYNGSQSFHFYLDKK